MTDPLSLARNSWEPTVAVPFGDMLLVLRRLAAGYPSALDMSVSAARSLVRKMWTLEHYAHRVFDALVTYPARLPRDSIDDFRKVQYAWEELVLLFALLSREYAELTAPMDYVHGLEVFRSRNMLNAASLFKKLHKLANKLRRVLLHIAYKYFGDDLQAQLLANTATLDMLVGAKQRPSSTSSRSVLASTPLLAATQMANTALASNSALFPQLHPLTTTATVGAPVQAVVPVLGAVPARPAVVLPDVGGASALAGLVPLASHNASQVLAMVEVAVRLSTAAGNSTIVTQPAQEVRVSNVTAVTRAVDAFLRTHHTQ